MNRWIQANRKGGLSIVQTEGTIANPNAVRYKLNRSLDDINRFGGNMRIWITALSSVAVLCSSVAFAQQADDPAATASLETFADEMFAAANTGNHDLFRATSEEASVFDIGFEGEPISVYGLEWNTHIDEVVTLVDANEAIVSYEVTRRDCHATETLGFCTIEFATQTTLATVTSAANWRMTLVARMVEGNWTWIHIHNSLGP